MSILKEHLLSLKRGLKAVQTNGGADDIPPTQSTILTNGGNNEQSDPKFSKKSDLDEELEALFEEIDNVTSGKPCKIPRIESPSSQEIHTQMNACEVQGSDDIDVFLATDDAFFSEFEKENTQLNSESGNINIQSGRESQCSKVGKVNPESNELPFPIDYNGDHVISFDDVDKNTNLILGPTEKWEQSSSKWIKVPKSLIFFTVYEQIGENWLVEMYDGSKISFEGTVSGEILEKHRPHFGMAIYAFDFTILFGVSKRPHAILTPRNVIKVFSNIHHV
jgi:hypothetical protein